MAGEEGGALLTALVLTATVSTTSRPHSAALRLRGFLLHTPHSAGVIPFPTEAAARFLSQRFHMVHGGRH